MHKKPYPQVIEKKKVIPKADCITGILLQVFLFYKSFIIKDIYFENTRLISLLLTIII